MITSMVVPGEGRIIVVLFDVSVMVVPAAEFRRPVWFVSVRPALTPGFAIGIAGFC